MLISVVVTCFNYADYVSEAIESVLTQDCEEKELIVIDDGSTDRSWEIISQYSDRATLLQGKNQGQANACFNALRKARGDFVLFLDADDKLRPGALKVLRKSLHPEISKLQFSLLPIDAQGNPIGDPFPNLPVFPNRTGLLEDIARRGSYDTPPCSGNIFRRDVIERVGEIPYERWIDGVTSLLAPYMGEVKHLNEALGFYRVHARNASAFAAGGSQRFTMEANRFHARLVHLQELCSRYALGSVPVRSPSSYSYILERNICLAVSEGQRPSASLILAWWQALAREGVRPLRRVFMVAWSSLLFGAPLQARRRLLALRTNPWSRPGFVQELKRVAAGREA